MVMVPSWMDYPTDIALRLQHNTCLHGSGVLADPQGAHPPRKTMATCVSLQ